MSTAKKLLPVLVVGGLIAWLLVTNEPPRTSAPFEAEGLTLHAYSPTSESAWEIRAHGGAVDGDESTLSDVEIDFFNAEAGQLTARAGHLVRTEGAATLSQGVIVERADGLRLATEAMSWNERAETLETGPIELRIGDVEATAPHFTYDLATERAQLDGGIQVHLDGEPSLHASGERAEEADGLFALDGDVKIVEESGVSYRCDRVEVETSAATGDKSEGKAIRMMGGVEATLSEGELRADQVDVRDAGITAVGNVSIRLDLSAEENDDGT